MAESVYEAGQRTEGGATAIILAECGRLPVGDDLGLECFDPCGHQKLLDLRPTPTPTMPATATPTINIPSLPTPGRSYTAMSTLISGGEYQAAQTVGQGTNAEQIKAIILTNQDSRRPGWYLRLLLDVTIAQVSGRNEQHLSVW